MKMIAHLDLNAFFAQVEEIKNPALAGKPVGVGGRSSRSVLSTANYEARRFGVFSGQPVSEARRLCPELVVVDGHYRDYAEYSDRFMNYLRQLFGELEQASIDECYIDMTDRFPLELAHDYLRDLQLELYRATGLKCSIGLGENRFLAKMGSDFQKPLGVTVIARADIQELIWPLPIEKMYGIGRRTHPKLKALGVTTIGDLAQTAEPAVRRLLGSNFEELAAHANGEGSASLSTAPSDPKSISSARTFDHDTSEYEELKLMLVHLAAAVAREMQDYRKTTDTVAITFRTADFTTSSKRMKFAAPSNQTAEITARALQVFDRYYDDQPLRLIGVAAVDIVDVDQLQEQLTLQSAALQPEEKREQSFELTASEQGRAAFKKAAAGHRQKERRPHDRFHIPEDDSDEN